MASINTSLDQKYIELTDIWIDEFTKEDLHKQYDSLCTNKVRYKRTTRYSDGWGECKC